jgi:hypothetical protein
MDAGNGKQEWGSVNGKVAGAREKQAKELGLAAVKSRKINVRCHRFASASQSDRSYQIKTVAEREPSITLLSYDRKASSAPRNGQLKEDG